MRILAPVLALVLAAASGSVPAQPAAAAVAEVHIAGFAFDPSDLTVVVGETVQWDNQDVPSHTVTADDGSFSSGNMANGATFTHTFTVAGSFPYSCLTHPSMKGKVVALDPAQLPDLVVASVAATETLPAVEARVDVVVRNIGEGEAPESQLAVGYLYQGDEQSIGVLSVGTIPAGGSTTVSVTWSTLGKVGDFVLVAHADADGAVLEQDEANGDGQGVASLLLPPGILDGIDLLDPV